jgi:dienelactone hydrolase
MIRNSDLMRHFMMQKAALAPKLAWQAKTTAEHQAWRKRFAQRLRRLVGHEPRAVPLQVEWVEKQETEAFIRHKIYIRSEEHYWIPAYFFVPRRPACPRPAIVCLHGHSGILPYIREGNEHQQQKCRELALDFAPLLAESGYVTIAPIQRGWNETAVSVDRNESGCQRMVLDSFLTGMTPIGLRCWDASRLADFLATQKCVDSSRIGVAGLSGGGMVALFWAALERRVRLAMVAGYYCTFEDSIYSIYHCLCNCVPGMLEWGEMRDIAALIAPRPLLIISGKQDPIFPIQATRQAFAALKPVYDLLDARPNLEKDFFNGPHAWSNRKTMAFLDKHFTLTKDCRAG